MVQVGTQGEATITIPPYHTRETKQNKHGKQQRFLFINEEFLPPTLGNRWVGNLLVCAFFFVVVVASQTKNGTKAIKECTNRNGI